MSNATKLSDVMVCGFSFSSEEDIEKYAAELDGRVDSACEADMREAATKREVSVLEHLLGNLLRYVQATGFERYLIGYECAAKVLLSITRYMRSLSALSRSIDSYEREELTTELARARKEICHLRSNRRVSPPMPDSLSVGRVSDFMPVNEDNKATIDRLKEEYGEAVNEAMRIHKLIKLYVNRC